MPESNNKSIINTLLSIYRDGLKKTPKLINVFLVVFSTFFILSTIFMFIFKKDIQEIITSSNEKILTDKEAKVKAANERIIKRINDSIEDMLSAERAKKAFQYRQEMEHESVEIKYLKLKNCIGVNYFSVHNGGHTIDVDGDWELDVYLSTEPAILKDFPEKEHQINTRIFKGWSWLSNIALQKETPFLIQDVSKEPKLFNGRAKEYLLQAKIKSCVVMLVENRGSEFLFISFNFDIINPQERNPELFPIVYEFKRFIKERI